MYELKTSGNTASLRLQKLLPTDEGCFQLVIICHCIVGS